MKSVRVLVNPQETLCTLVHRGEKTVVPIQESPFYKAAKTGSLMPIIDYLDGYLGRDFQDQCLLMSNIMWTLSLNELIKRQGFVPGAYGTWPILMGRVVQDGLRRISFAAAQGMTEVEVENKIQGLYPWWSQAFRVGDGWVDIAFPPDYEYQTGDRTLCQDTWNRLSPFLSLEGKSVLDLGCGPGFYCHRAIDAGAVNVTGVDRSEHILQSTNPNLKQNVVDQAKDAAWLCGYGEKIQYFAIDLNGFKMIRMWDIVLALRVHYHLEAPTLFLAEISKNAREALVVQCNPVHGIEAGTVEFTIAALSPFWKEIKQISGPDLPILICKEKYESNNG
ncbi:MAG: class I SAM-dependent methyltransferase [Gammaproteobacteria bacterium]|nr:class I SAM-dependent methyltransferase [Gammaproteobacteria bacterium]